MGYCWGVYLVIVYLRFIQYKMRRIQKILWYNPIIDYNIELLKKWWFYNWTWTDWVFFDDLIDLVFLKIIDSKIFEANKSYILRKDIEQLIIRHDIDIWFKIWFLKSNLRLSIWLFRLLSKFKIKYRFWVWFWVFLLVHCTEKARNNYKR
jgi:hypothetical protein